MMDVKITENDKIALEKLESVFLDASIQMERWRSLLRDGKISFGYFELATKELRSMILMSKKKQGYQTDFNPTYMGSGLYEVKMPNGIIRS